MTAKQVAAKVREHLKRAVAAADREGVIIFTHTDGSTYGLALPQGLLFDVRATRTGVNIRILDGGYVDRVTDGDRRAWGEHREAREAVVTQLQEYEQRVWGGPLGRVEWGTVFISSEVTSESVVRYGEQAP